MSQTLYTPIQFDLMMERFQEIRRIVHTGTKYGPEYIKKISVTIDCTDEVILEESDECGICYENKCTITTNCGHKYCRGCIQSHLKTMIHRNPCCAFCRLTVTQLNVVDASAHDILSAFIEKIV
jgi:hypothetical protein